MTDNHTLERFVYNTFQATSETTWKG